MDFTPPTSGQSAVAKTTNLSNTVDYQDDKRVPYIGTGKDFDAVVRTLKGAIDRGEIDKENLHRLAHSFGIKPAELAAMVGVDKDSIEAKDQDDGPENSVSPPQVSKTFKEFRSETRAVPTEIPCNDELPHASVTESVTIAGVKLPKDAQRRHMNDLAKTIANLPPKERKKYHDEGARYLKNSNPLFNAQRFRAACNLEAEMNESSHPALDPSSDNVTSDPKKARELNAKKDDKTTMDRVRAAAKDAMQKAMNAKALQKESANQTNQDIINMRRSGIKIDANTRRDLQLTNRQGSQGNKTLTAAQDMKARLMKMYTNPKMRNLIRQQQRQERQSGKF